MMAHLQRERALTRSSRHLHALFSCSNQDSTPISAPGGPHGSRGEVRRQSVSSTYSYVEVLERAVEEEMLLHALICTCRHRTSTAQAYLTPTRSHGER